MCRYTLAKFILLLSLTISSFNSMAGVGTNYNRKGVVIKYNTPQASHVKYDSGETAQLNGSICVSKYSSIFNKLKCRATLQGNVSIRAYFPDAMTEVTDQLAVKKKGQEYQWSFNTPELISGNENTLHILVAKEDPKIKKYERLQAKLNKRIVLLEKRIQQRNKRGSSIHLISWLNDLKDRLERVSKNIDELIEEDASVLAQIKIPLQVDNDVAFPFYYSSFFSGHKMSLRAPIGSAIEGDRVTVEAASKNLSSKSFWFPGIDDKNDKNDESFNDDGLNQYKLDLYFNNALKVSSGFSEIAYGQENKITFDTDKLSISDLNNFDLKLTKKLNLHFKLFKKKVSLDFPYGEIGFTLPVSIDDVKPIISTDFYKEGETSLSKFENVKYLAKDSFGHLVNDSISIEIKNAQDEAVTGTSVTSAKISAEEVEYNVSNLSLADGSYQITALIKDNAGNESTKLLNEFFVDNSAPTLIENNTPNGFITGDELDLDFKVSDVSSVEVIVFSNGEKLLTTSNKHVQESITLSSGENIISAKVTDSLRNTVIVDIATVSIDNDAPVLANNSTSSGYTANSSLTLNFSVTDISTVTTDVFNNGIKVLSTTNKSVNESITLSSGINNISVVMTDAAGNVSNAEISSITLDNVSPKLLRNANSDSILSTETYKLDFTVQDSTLATTTIYNNGSKILETNENLVNNTISLNYGVNEITVSMSDLAGNTSSTNIAKLTLDNKKPVLAQNNTQGGLTANKSLSLDFSIEDITAVDIKVLRNGVEVLSSIEKVINTSIELVEGSNEITAIVLDQAGNTESFTIAQVIYDGIKPTISSINLVEGQSLDSLNYELNGIVSEELSSLSINGDSVTVNESSFSYKLSNTEEGAKSIVITMTDLAGNTNELTINYSIQLAPEEFECLKQDFSEATACSGEYIAQSFSDVESYKSSSDLNSKNLVLAFSYSGEEHLIVHTPCSINVAENFSFSTTGGICLDSRAGLNIQKQSQISANEVNLFSDGLINIEENASLNSVDSFSASSPECTLKNTALTGSGNCFDPSRPVVNVSTTKTNLEIGETLSFSTSESVVPNGISTVEFFINNLKQEISTNSFNHTFNEEGIFYVKAKVTDSNGYISSDEIKIIVSAPIINTREAFFKYAVEDEMLELIFVQSIPRDQIKTAKFVVDGQDYVLPNYYHLDSIYINDISLGNHDVILEVTDIYNRVFKYQRSVFVGTNEEMAQLPPVMEFEVVPSAPRKVFIEFRDVFDPAKLFDGLVINWGDGQESEHWIPDEGGVKHQYASAGTYEVSVEFVKYGDEVLVTTLTKEVVVTDDEVSPAPPIVNFRYEKQYFAPHVTFNVDLSMSPTGEIVSRTFDYGDGTVYTGNEPVHTHFYEPGTYYPTLTIVDEYGMTASQTARVIIAEEGEEFISHLECFDEGGLFVGCDVVALAKDEEIQSIEIDWGDGNTETFEPAFSSWTWDFFDYEYSEPDNYVIQMTVRTSYGSYADSVEYNNQEVKDDIAPYVSFNCHSPSSLKLSCQNHSTDDGVIVSSIWKINGVEYTSLNLDEVSVSASGNVDVSLTVTDDSGKSSTSNQVVLISENILPVVAFNCVQASQTQLSCNSTSYDPDGYITSSNFYVNEVLYSGESVLIEVDGQESVKVTLIIEDNEGQVSTFNKLIALNKAPVAAFSCTQKNKESVITCNAQETQDEDISSLNYSWVISETIHSGLSFDSQVSYGTHIVVLTVSDSFGLQSTLEKEVILYNYDNVPEPMFAHYFEVGNVGVFNGSLSLSENREVALYTWFVDGQEVQSSSDFNFQYSFADNNEHSVKLIVKDSLDRSAEYSETIRPYDPEVLVPDIVENFENLLGVDSDNNGIRDDIQRFYIPISLNNSDYRRYLDKVVRNLQLIFKNQEDHNFIRMLIQENKDVYSCIQKLEDPNIYKSMIDKHLHTLNYNSKKRLEFYYTIKYIYQEDYENGSFDCEGV
ncbi:MULTISPECIES: PKD domain-containing protein [unclassified Halobacteriovorax]|uniref:PKD domain-containing protein n=2 Tax=unclassified Halobacteriovorax TaxID=2639665 RepID=UPI00399A72EA